MLAGVSVGVLLPPRTRRRRRSLREHPRRHRRRPAARRRRTPPPARPRPHRRRHPRAPAPHPGASASARPSSTLLDAITARPPSSTTAASTILGRQRPRQGPVLARCSPTGDEQPNSARFTFLDPARHEFFRDWDKAADDTVAILRAEAGRDPYDRNLSDLIGELSTRSEEFRTRWASHDVRIHATGTKRLHHPVVGDLDLSYESFPAPDQGQNLLVYVAEPHSPSHDALNLLASYAATHQPERADAPAQRQP